MGNYKGSIIPQLEVRQHLTDGEANPITLNLIPHVFMHRPKSSVSALIIRS